MRLSNLTNKNLILLKSDLQTKDEVIRALVKKLYSEGKIRSEEEFYEAVMERESLSETGMEGGLAIPHGKADCVKEAAFAIATTKKAVKDWESLDPDNEVQYIFLLAIPTAESGSTHLELLGELMQKMSNEGYKKKLFNSKTVEELYNNLDSAIEEKEEQINYTKTIVAVTACPAGIAHTYMAAEALKKAGDELGVKVFVEKQGANGIEDKITNQQLKEADAAIFSVAVAVKGSERFDHLPLVKTTVSEPLKDAKKIITKALEKAEKQGKSDYVELEDEEKSDSIGSIIKQSLMTGISYIIPIIVAGGMIGAFAVIITNVFGLQSLATTEGSWLWLFKGLGSNLLGTMMIPILSAYMAYSIADKTALAPGFAAGVAANMIAGGFLCGMLGGLLAGFVIKYMRKYIPAKGTFAGFISFWVYPVLSTLIIGIIIFLIIGKPVAWLNASLISALGALGGSNAALLGGILGIMVSFDLGGPVNKAAYAFCIGAMAEGIIMPYAVFASVKMVSGFAITIATIVGKRLYTIEEQEIGKSTWILVLAGITEGAIPFMIADPIRVILSLCAGSAVTGAIVAMCNIGLDVPGAGIFSIFVLKDGIGGLANVGIWVGAAILGAAISSVLLIATRKQKIKKLKMRG
ncbi:MAG: PTS 2-O-a-mannosyl-D-glycerate transporter subunit IIABC [Eubacteriaceae bacterium]